MSIDYTLDLGFNWDAPPVGTALASGKTLSFRPLQWGLMATDSQLPAWTTQMKAGDTIRFRLTDITQAPGSTPSTVAPTVGELAPGSFQPIRTVTRVALGFTNPSGSGVDAYPFSQEPPGVFTNRLGDSPDLEGLVYNESEIPFQAQETSSPVFNCANPSWPVARWCVGLASGGDVYTFAAECFAEMGVSVEVQDGSGDSRTFGFDPEFFVGGTGGSGG
ncbi:MAG: hypothetical protein AAFY88_14665 [Acidobacteriota bacterium]